MAKPLSKNQQRVAVKKKRMAKKERQDALGISRKRYKFVVSPKLFLILKAVAVVSLPIVYFVYSPLLVVDMLLFVALFFLAIGCEHGMNKSVIRSNHIHIPKYDSAVALVLVCISFFQAVFGSSGGSAARFARSLFRQVVQKIKSFGALQTGIRTVFGSSAGFQFGSMEKPDNFVPSGEAFRDQMGGMPPGDMPGGRPDFEVSMDNVPVEFMFSQVYSTIATLLIILVGVLGALSLIYTIRRMRKFEKEQSEPIPDGEIVLLSDEEIAKIINFGEDEEPLEGASESLSSEAGKIPS